MHLGTELRQYRSVFEAELKNNILAYWLTHGVEATGEGFYGAVDLGNQPVLSAHKSSVLNARILWTFSEAARLFNDEEYRWAANRANRVMTTRFLDDIHGGYFMALSPENQISDDTKHTYAQAFVIYALSKYYQLYPTGEALALVKDLFLLLEERTRDGHHLGYYEAFTRDWKRLSKNRMADNDEPKTMNTHLHVLEAYASLYEVWPDSRVQSRLEELLLIFLEHIIRPSGHLGLFFDSDFNEVSHSRGICSFGHDIEASWLLWEAAKILGDASLLERTRKACLNMLAVVERVGLDKDGGMFLESYRQGSHVRTNKHWWLQAETLVGFMNGFELTGNPRYWENVKLSWDFIDRHIIDHEGGEWFTKVDRLGLPFVYEPPDDPSPYYRNDWKIDPWKAPYHNGRACMEMMKRIDRIGVQQS